MIGSKDKDVKPLDYCTVAGIINWFNCYEKLAVPTEVALGIPCDSEILLLGIGPMEVYVYVYKNTKRNLLEQILELFKYLLMIRRMNVILYLHKGTLPNNQSK